LDEIKYIKFTGGAHKWINIHKKILKF
jgi:hypothetical protein